MDRGFGLPLSAKAQRIMCGSCVGVSLWLAGPQSASSPVDGRRVCRSRPLFVSVAHMWSCKRSPSMRISASCLLCNHVSWLVFSERLCSLGLDFSCRSGFLESKCNDALLRFARNPSRDATGCINTHLHLNLNTHVHARICFNLDFNLTAVWLAMHAPASPCGCESHRCRAGHPWDGTDSHGEQRRPAGEERRPFQTQ